MATRFNDRRTAAAAEINEDTPISVVSGSEAISRPAGLSPVIQGTPGPVVGRVIDLKSLTQSPGLIFQGDSAYDLAGRSVASAGDFNGDGLGDLIVGGPFGDDGGTDSSEAVAVHGFLTNALNNAPVLAYPLVDLARSQGKEFNFTIPSGSFVDPDGDALTYTATLSNGLPLPDWLHFDPLNLTFSGDARQATSNRVEVSIHASDGREQVSDTFTFLLAKDVVDINLVTGIESASGQPFLDITVEMSVFHDQATHIEVWIGPINALKPYQVPMDLQTGLFNLKVLLPAYARDGEYIVNAINAIDNTGRFVSLVAGEFPETATALSATLANPNADNTAPVLGEVAVSSIIYSDEDVRINVALSVSDAGGSGIDFSRATIGMLNPSGRGFGAGITYDNALNGSATFIISRYAPSGTYSVSGISLFDNAGNQATTGFSPIEFIINNANQDIRPASLIDLKLTAIFDEITERPIIIKSGSASDALSGVATVTVILQRPGDGVNYGSGEQLSLYPRADGTVVAFQGQEALSGNFVSGEYFVEQVVLTDRADNLSYVTGPQLLSMGLADRIGIYGGQTVTGSAIDDYIFGSKRTDDFLNGGAGDDVIYGFDGDDVIDGGYGDDRIFAGSGNDTAVGGVGNNTIDGGAGWDIVTVSWPASAYRLLKDGDNFILKGPDSGDSLTNVEAIRFVDGKILDLARMYGPDVDARAWADGRIPEALLSDAASSQERPLVLPGAGGDDVLVAKDGGGPEVLPAVEDVVTSAKAFDGPEVLPTAPSDKFLVEAEVLPPLPSDHLSAEVPEVLPALDDGFLFTGKFDDLPPVMPTLPDDIDSWDVAAVFRPGSETLALILEGAEHPYGHSLTLLDELPAVPSKGDAWE